jgi:hypothetical protein
MTLDIRKIALAFSVSAILAILTGCPFDDPAFPGGVRVKTVESISSVGNSQFPVPGVSFTGDATGSVGPNNTGTQQYIDGTTGSGGLKDFPQALTDVSWNVAMDWSEAIPQCPPTVGQFYVPGTGGEILGNCYTLNF